MINDQTERKEITSNLSRLVCGFQRNTRFRRLYLLFIVVRNFARVLGAFSDTSFAISQVIFSARILHYRREK